MKHYTLLLISILILSHTSLYSKEYRSNLNPNVIKMSITITKTNDIHAVITNLPSFIDTCYPEIPLEITLKNNSDTNSPQMELSLIPNPSSIRGVKPIVIPPQPGSKSYSQETIFHIESIEVQPENAYYILSLENIQNLNIVDQWSLEFRFCPNLTITKPSVLADAIGFQAFWTAANIGGSVNTSFLTSLYLSEDRFLDEDDIKFADRRTDNLPANRSLDQNLTILGPPNQFQNYNGYIIFKIDSKDNIKEKNEKNNIVSVKLPSAYSDTKETSTLFPSPFSDRLHVHIDNKKSSSDITLQLYGLHGRIVKEFALKRSSIGSKSFFDSGSLEKGTYIYKLFINGKVITGNIQKK